MPGYLDHEIAPGLVHPVEHPEVSGGLQPGQPLLRSQERFLELAVQRNTIVRDGDVKPALPAEEPQILTRKSRARKRQTN